MALLGGKRVVVKALSLGAVPGTVTVLPCQRSIVGTFRQASPGAMLDVAAEALQLGPFALTIGRAPAHVREHLEQAQPGWRPAPPAPRPDPSPALGPMPASLAEQCPLLQATLLPRFKYPFRLKALMSLGFESERAQLRDLLTKHRGDAWAALDEFLRQSERGAEEKATRAPTPDHGFRARLGGA